MHKTIQKFYLISLKDFIKQFNRLCLRLYLFLYRVFNFSAFKLIKIQKRLSHSTDSKNLNVPSWPTFLRSSTRYFAVSTSFVYKRLVDELCNRQVIFYNAFMDALCVDVSLNCQTIQFANLLSLKMIRVIVDPELALKVASEKAVTFKIYKTGL